MRELIKRCTPLSIRKLYRKLRSKIFSTLRPYRDAHTLRATMKLAVQKRESRTSVSDNGYYPLVCYLAAKYDAVFKNFKRNFIYCQTLECSNEQEQYGSHMLKLIDNISGFNPTPEDWQDFSRNDLYGNPRTYPVTFGDRTITLSSSTIRYAKVLGEIMSLFDTENIKSVAEVGVGYGGQCRILMSRLPIEQYTLFDLPEALALSERFLINYDETRNNIRYIDGGHIYTDDQYDLFISNHAFTELKREIQDMYMEKLILKSKRGYITWNCGADRWGGYSVEEFMNLIHGSSRLEADRPDICIVVWGNK